LAAAGFAPASLTAAVAMVASGFFFGAMRPIINALVADLCDETTRRAAFSLSYLGINLGVSIGPVLAGWLFQNALNWLFWLDAVSTGAALVILIGFVPRNSRPLLLPQDTAAHESPALTAFLRHPILLPFSLLLLVYDFVYAQMIFTLALQMVDLFGPSGPQTYGLGGQRGGLPDLDSLGAEIY